MTDRIITREQLIEFFLPMYVSSHASMQRAVAEERADAFIERFFEGATLIMPNPVEEPQIINLDELSETLDPEHMKLFTETRATAGEPSRVVVKRAVQVMPYPLFELPEDQRYELLSEEDAATVREEGGSLHGLIQADCGGIAFTQPPVLESEPGWKDEAWDKFDSPVLPDDCECEDREALVRPEGLVCGTCGKLIEARSGGWIAPSEAGVVPDKKCDAICDGDGGRSSCFTPWCRCTVCH